MKQWHFLLPPSAPTTGFQDLLLCRAHSPLEGLLQILSIFCISVPILTCFSCSLGGKKIKLFSSSFLLGINWMLS